MSVFLDSQVQWAEGVWEKCERKYGRLAEIYQGIIPYTTDADGKFDNRADETVSWAPDDGINWWTNGFWAGIMWHLYASSGNERFAREAQRSEELLDRCFEEFYGLHHDVGFMWLPTAVADYRFTGNPESRRRALHAANLLMGRFNLAGRFIRAWNDHLESDSRGWAIIDCMLNIPLLYWASGETGDPRYRQAAKAHADTVMKYFIREDGSSCHIVEFRPDTGEFVAEHGGQGYSKGSSWTRGQAWALYGFTVSYGCTGDAGYLDTAVKAADYFTSHIPDTGYIPADFKQPANSRLEDSAAAAIASCGLIELAGICEGERRRRYAQAAMIMLKSLDAGRCDYGEDQDAVLTHCTGAWHSPDSHHIRMIYADYFYMEALCKITGKRSEFYW